MPTRHRLKDIHDGFGYLLGSLGLAIAILGLLPPIIQVLVILSAASAVAFFFKTARDPEAVADLLVGPETSGATSQSALARSLERMLGMARFVWGDAWGVRALLVCMGIAILYVNVGLLLQWVAGGPMPYVNGRPILPSENVSSMQKGTIVIVSALLGIFIFLSFAYAFEIGNAINRTAVRLGISVNENAHITPAEIVALFVILVVFVCPALIEFAPSARSAVLIYALGAFAGFAATIVGVGHVHGLASGLMGFSLAVSPIIAAGNSSRLAELGMVVLAVAFASTAAGVTALSVRIFEDQRRRLTTDHSGVVTEAPSGSGTESIGYHPLVGGFVGAVGGFTAGFFAGIAMFFGVQVPPSLAAFVALVLIIPLLNSIFDWAAVNVTIQQLQTAMRRRSTSGAGGSGSGISTDEAPLALLGWRIGGTLVVISAAAPALLLLLFAFCVKMLETFFGGLGVRLDLATTLAGGLTASNIFVLLMLYSTALPAYVFVVAAMLTFGEALVQKLSTLMTGEKTTGREAVVSTLCDGRNIAFYSMGFGIVVMLAGICLLVGLYLPWAFTRTVVYPAVAQLVAA